MMMMVLRGYCLQWLWENTISSYFSEVSQHHAVDLNIFIAYLFRLGDILHTGFRNRLDAEFKMDGMQFCIIIIMFKCI